MNGEVIFFSFSKINALLYYLFINKNVSRDELAGLLWPDKNEQNAKKNLRNAIYQANKAFDVEVISSPNKSILTLNEALDIEIDTDLFLEDAQTHLHLYTHEFLKGFFLKDCDSFDFWTVKMRSFFEKRFLQECGHKIKEDIDNERFESVEKNIHRLIYIDEYDESNYQLLMRFYQLTGKDSKVIETYYDLSNLLKSELNIKPNSKSKELYETSLETLNQQNLRESNRFNDLFYGRYLELQQLEMNFQKFKSGMPFKSIAIRGEAGVGKSALKNRVLDNVDEDLKVLETQCYQAEEKHTLRPWKQIVDQLSVMINDQDDVEPELWNDIISQVFPNFDEYLPDARELVSQTPVKLTLLSELLTEVLNKLSENQKLVLVFEDIQWMDATSLSLLTGVMLHVEDSIIFVYTARSVEKENMDRFLCSMHKYQKLMCVELFPFTYSESKEFIHKKLTEATVTETMVNNVYDHTQGNLFFLIEYISLLKSNSNLNTMTIKMKDALRNRFLYLTQEEQDLVSIASYFYDYAPLTLMNDLLGKDPLVIVELVESLVKKNILKEVMIKDELAVAFTHIKLREFVYMNQGSAKKRMMHEAIAKYLEAAVPENSNDSLLFDNISYHYKKGNNLLKSLEYKLKYLESSLGYFHELFPVDAYRNNIVDDSSVLSKSWIFDEFDKIRHQLESGEDKFEEDDLFKQLQLNFWYLEGRYLIKYGEYQQGVANIQEMMTQAKELEDEKYLLAGYKQMIYYYIQIDEPEKMVRFIELALDLSIKGNNHQSIGILLRLKGLYNIMCGNYLVAEQLLNESINTFMITEKIAKKYAINIAASYNYLGEIKLSQGEIDASLEMFNKAIKLCEDKEVLASLSVFYMNAGIAHFALDHYEEAEVQFLKAQVLYEELFTYWKKTRLDAYYALIHVERHHLDDAYQALMNAKRYADRMGNKRDTGVVFFAKAIIKKKLETGEIEHDALNQALEKTSEVYYDEAIENLNMYQDSLERRLLMETFGR